MLLKRCSKPVHAYICSPADVIVITLDQWTVMHSASQSAKYTLRPLPYSQLQRQLNMRQTI